MRIFWLIIIGIIGGLVAGMGMGGGTLLIPLLTIFMDVEQIIAQSINLLVFIPMSIIVSIIYIKNKLVCKDGLLAMIVPASITAVLSSLLINVAGNRPLAISYGIFLVISGVSFITITLVKWIKAKKNENPSESSGDFDGGRR